jgi:hypothetical protein
MAIRPYIATRKKEEGRRKKEEGRRKKEERMNHKGTEDTEGRRKRVNN